MRLERETRIAKSANTTRSPSQQSLNTVQHQPGARSRASSLSLQQSNTVKTSPRPVHTRSGPSAAQSNQPNLVVAALTPPASRAQTAGGTAGRGRIRERSRGWRTGQTGPPQRRPAALPATSTSSIHRYNPAARKDHGCNGWQVRLSYWPAYQLMLCHSGRQGTEADIAEHKAGSPACLDPPNSANVTIVCSGWYVTAIPTLCMG